MAFNAKNLHYDKQEPAFLRKLKGEFGNLDGRHNVQIARPKKDRLKTGDDDEDEPVIVDEQGERIEKAEFERRAKGEDEVGDPGTTEDAEVSKAEGEDGAKQIERQKVAEIGSSANAKKRKAVKVVGGDDENDRNRSSKSPEQREKSAKDKTERAPTTKTAAAPPKKKGKKIKLSFDEPE